MSWVQLDLPKPDAAKLAEESPFNTCAITTEGIGLEVQLEKPVA
jgi:hypothetical protein